MMTTETATDRNVFTPKETFTIDIDGVPTTLRHNKSFVRAGHPLLDEYPQLFEPVAVQFDVEQATAAPGERRAR
jgi:hypothetical protein